MGLCMPNSSVLSLSNINQTISDFTRACGDYTADCIEQRKIPPSLVENLIYAKEAVNYTLVALPLGASNVKDAKIDRKIMESIRKEVDETIGKRHVYSTEAELNLVKANTRIQLAESTGIGNCHEHTLVALNYLRKIKGFEAVEPVCISNNDHAFLVIGRDPASKLSDVHTWGDSAVICDPWGHRYFPAVDLEYRITDLLASRRDFYKPFELRTQSIQKLPECVSLSIKSTSVEQVKPALIGNEDVLDKLTRYERLQHRSEIYSLIQQHSEVVSVTSLVSGIFLSRKNLLKSKRVSPIMGCSFVAISIAAYSIGQFFEHHANSYSKEAYNPWK